MSKRQNLEDFFEKISLAQRISSKDKAFVDYSGADTELSSQIAFFNIALKHKLIEKTPELEFMLALLKEQSKAVFASSPTTDVYTKLGFRLPKSERRIDLGSDKTSPG